MYSDANLHLRSKKAMYDVFYVSTLGDNMVLLLLYEHEFCAGSLDLRSFNPRTF